MSKALTVASLTCFLWERPGKPLASMSCSNPAKAEAERAGTLRLVASSLCNFSALSMKACNCTSEIKCQQRIEPSTCCAHHAPCCHGWNKGSVPNSTAWHEFKTCLVYTALHVAVATISCMCSCHAMQDKCMQTKQVLLKSLQLLSCT